MLGHVLPVVGSGFGVVVVASSMGVLRTRLSSGLHV